MPASHSLLFAIVHCQSHPSSPKPYPAPNRILQEWEHGQTKLKIAGALQSIYLRPPGTSTTLDNAYVATPSRASLCSVCLLYAGFEVIAARTARLCQCWSSVEGVTPSACHGARQNLACLA